MNRTGRGQFQKGRSGNAGGRPKAALSLKAAVVFKACWGGEHLESLNDLARLVLTSDGRTMLNALLGD
jgi:hypothetical protein